MGQSEGDDTMHDEVTELYHGSNTAIERPDIARNVGFADLGRGFYLTPDHEGATRRARRRSRMAGGEATVSAFAWDASSVPWVTWGATLAAEGDAVNSVPFGLAFEATPEGYGAWAAYINACRGGHTEVEDWGDPAVVRAWIATEEVELVCSGHLSPFEFAQVVEPSELIVQYCFRDQGVLDRSLSFVRAEVV